MIYTTLKTYYIKSANKTEMLYDLVTERYTVCHSVCMGFQGCKKTVE